MNVKMVLDEKKNVRIFHVITGLHREEKNTRYYICCIIYDIWQNRRNDIYKQKPMFCEYMKWNERLKIINKKNRQSNAVKQQFLLDFCCCWCYISFSILLLLLLLVYAFFCILQLTANRVRDRKFLF